MDSAGAVAPMAVGETQAGAGAAGEAAATGCVACDTKRKVAHTCEKRRRGSAVGGRGTKRPCAGDLSFDAAGHAWSRNDANMVKDQLAELRAENAKVRSSHSHTHGCSFPPLPAHARSCPQLSQRLDQRDTLISKLAERVKRLEEEEHEEEEDEEEEDEEEEDEEDKEDKRLQLLLEEWALPLDRSARVHRGPSARPSGLAAVQRAQPAHCRFRCGRKPP